MENLKLTKPWNTLNTRKNDLNRSNSTSLGFDIRNLQYMKQFYKNFPIANALRSELSWTHYRLLCTCVTRPSWSELHSDSRLTFPVSRCAAHSMNNNPENILILCPNHHRVIHKAGGVFDNVNNWYQYNNGFTDKINKISKL